MSLYSTRLRKTHTLDNTFLHHHQSRWTVNKNGTLRRYSIPRLFGDDLSTWLNGSVTKPTGNLRKTSTSFKLSKTSTGDTLTYRARYQMVITNGLPGGSTLEGDSVTALILGFDDSILSQQLLINVFSSHVSRFYL